MTFNAAVPYSFKFIIDRALIGGFRGIPLLCVGWTRCRSDPCAHFGLTRDYYYARLVARVLSDIRETLFSHLQRLSTGFYGRAQVGDLLSRFRAILPLWNRQ